MHRHFDAAMAPARPCTALFQQGARGHQGSPSALSPVHLEGFWSQLQWVSGGPSVLLH